MPTFSSPSKRYRLHILYDGTDYSGWQIQPNADSIQERLEKALATLLRHPTRVIGSGRTDAGVHARGQVGHFETPVTLSSRPFLYSINGLLPKDIRVWAVEEVSQEFHAQYSALSKTYHYHVHTLPFQDPFTRRYSHHQAMPLNLDRLQEAAALLVGTHDFTSFANSALEGSAAKNPVRTLQRLDFVPEPHGFRLEFQSDGFLYKMVRNLTGTLLDVAKGKLEVSAVTQILEARDRKVASLAAPALGLFLMEVSYPDPQSSGVK